MRGMCCQAAGTCDYSPSPTGQLQQFSGCCDCLYKFFNTFLSTSSNGHQSDCHDVDIYSSEFTLWKDSTAYDKQCTVGGGRFFVCTGSKFVDSSSKVRTVVDPSRRRNEEQVCYEYVGKSSLCTGASITIGQLDATFPAAGGLLSGDHSEFACGNDANGSLVQCRSNSLGLSSTGKTCRSLKDLNSGSAKKVQTENLKSCGNTFSSATEYFLSPTTCRSFNILENSCSNSFLTDFKIWNKTSISCLSEQNIVVSNDSKSPAKELINFDRQSLCMTILKQAERNPVVALVCSKLARHGYLSRGRGAVALMFKTSGRANQFIAPDFTAASLYYVYRNDSSANSEWPGKHQSKFAHLCQFYNPECQYIFSVSVDAFEEVCCNALSIQDEDLISQLDDDLVAAFCAKLPVYILCSLNLSLDINDAGSTLILTPVPGSGLSENGDERRTREICFINIQQKLRQRGVSLRHQLPQIYRRLCAYTENNAEFVPVSLFLFDSNTGKKFLCLIMPNSEPFCSWTEELFGELIPETIV